MSMDQGRCYACDRSLGRAAPFEVWTADNQMVWIGRDCFLRVAGAADDGYQPQKGGPRLYIVPPSRKRGA